MQKDTKELYDITEVCRLLGVTSRALRFYQEKGLIESTVSPFSSRRKYSDEQLSRIRDVLTLRALGLSIKTIAKLQQQHTDLKNALLARRAEMLAAVEKKGREIDILNQALASMQSGHNKEHENSITEMPAPLDELSEIASRCVYAVIEGDTDVLYDHTSRQLAAYMPREVFERVRKDALEPLERFVSVVSITADPQYPHVFYGIARYEALGLKIKLVFYGGKLDGLWINYCEL